MAFDGTRGALYDASSDSTYKLNYPTGKVHIISEDISLKAGIAKISIPGLSTTGNLMSSVFGRVRVINVRGIVFGTQQAIESFLRQFANHINQNGTQDELRYYPLFHPDITGSEGTQTHYYDVLINDFTYRSELTEAGYAARYSLELFEGTTVL